MSTVSAAQPSLVDDPAVLFFDADGTLVWTDEEAMKNGADFNDFLPNGSVREAFERLHERGHQAYLYLCTGRPLSLVPQGLLDLGFTGIIAGAGSCISMGDQVVFESIIPREVVRQAADLLPRMGVRALLESHRMPVMVAPDREPQPGFVEIPVACDAEEVERFAPEMEFCKISHMGGADWHQGAFDALIREYFDERDMGMATELSLRGVDKGAAIRRVLELTGHSMRNTYAFGDSENDLSMFPAVETAVAMGNAMPCLQERADYVTGHANGDGILRALEHFELV